MDSKLDDFVSNHENSEEIIFMGTNVPNQNEDKVAKSMRNQEKKCKLCVILYSSYFLKHYLYRHQIDFENVSYNPLLDLINNYKVKCL
jgi:hypothetical protein